MSQNRKFLVFEGPHNLTDYLLKRWIELSVNTIKQGRDFTAALSGGRSPVEFYCKLAGLQNLELWKRIHLFLGDERFVPFDDEDSNFGALKRNLIDYINIPDANIHPIRTDLNDASESAQVFSEELKNFFKLKDGELPAFDLLLLGLGKDGHTASLFPGQDGLNAEKKLAVQSSRSNIKHDRVSLTLPVINNAAQIFMIITGEEKADIVKAVFQDGFVCPAAMVNPSQGKVTYLMDRKAVSKLSDEIEYVHEGRAVSLKGLFNGN